MYFFFLIFLHCPYVVWFNYSVYVAKKNNWKYSFTIVKTKSLMIFEMQIFRKFKCLNHQMVLKGIQV